MNFGELVSSLQIEAHGEYLQLSPESYGLIASISEPGMRHVAYHHACGAAFRSASASDPEFEDAIRTRGFAPRRQVFSPPVIARARDFISERVADPEHATLLEGIYQSFPYRPNRQTTMVLASRTRDYEFVEELLQIALRPEIVGPMERALSSHLRLDHFEFIRTEPLADADGSYTWHVDKAPFGEAHLMIYLTDPKPDGSGGVTEVIPQGPTMKLRETGYFARPVAERLSSLRAIIEAGYDPGIDIEAEVVRPVLGAGDGLVFLAGLAAHRGIPPASGVRDVMLIVMKPSLNPWTVEFQRTGLQPFLSRQLGSLPIFSHPADV